MANSSPTYQCTICLKTLGKNLTKQKACDHIICNSCAEKVRHTGKSCPKCRELPSPTELYESVTIPCSPAAESEYATEGEDPVCYDEYVEPAFGKPLYARTCPDHNQKTDFFCKTCTTAACSRCLQKTHKIGKHDVSSLDDFLDNQLEEKLKEIGSIDEKLKTLERETGEARQASDTYMKSLWSKVVLKQRKANNAIESLVEALSRMLNENKAATSEFFSSIDTQRGNIAAETDKTRELAEELLSATTGSKERIPLEVIEKRIIDIATKCDEVANTSLPNDLKLTFNDDDENIESLGLGKLVTLRPGEGNPGQCYVNLSESKEWQLHRTLTTDGDEFDYANVVPMTDEWIVHVSNLYSSADVTIKHYELGEKSSSRSTLVLEVEHYNWILAKAAGHDRSILLASGNTVHRISFRRKEKDFRQKMKVPFNIEAISWDEFGVDCYLLDKNLRDVHWLSMDGKVTLLCSLPTNIQSASSMVVSDQCVISILDPSTSNVHTRDHIDSESTDNFILKRPFSGESDESIPPIPLTMAWNRLLMRYFVLYSRNNSAMVGEYDKEFRFRKWAVISEIPDQSSALDMSVRGDCLTLLFESSMAVYKIKPRQSLATRSDDD